MSIGLIIILTLLILLLYLLCFPISVKADTRNNSYYAGLPCIAGFRISRVHEKWKIQYSILFLRFNINFLKEAQKRDHALMEKQHKTRSKNSRSAQFYLRLAIKILSAFSIKSLIWSIDTGDYPLNAQLIPVVSSLNNNRVMLSINFYDKNEFYLLVQTRLIKILYTTIKYYMFNK